MYPISSGNFDVSDPSLALLADYLESHADVIVQRAERAWESSILLFAQLTEEQRAQIRRLARATIDVWAIRLRQDPAYARRVHELGQRWGTQAAGWELHVYSFTHALDLLAHAIWEYLAESYPKEQLTPSSVFFLGRSRDQLLNDLQVPLMSVYLQQREFEMEQTHFSLTGPLSLPGRSLLRELANRLRARKEDVIPTWMDSVQRTEGVTPALEELFKRRGSVLVDLLLSLLESPTAATGAASLSNVRAIGLESAQAGISFQEMFHALQQLRPIIWEMIYEIYRREQYWHPAEFIEAMARLHLLLDLFSEGIGQAYLQQKETIIQQQAEALHRRDLNLAREMLQSLLPKDQLNIPQLDVGCAWMPSLEIGGDFYDIFPMTDDDVMFLIGDVSGKGISAALLVSMVKYVIKANAPMHHSPATLLQIANRFFYHDMAPELFVTLFAAVYNYPTGTITYTSAGHEPAVLCEISEEPHRLELPSQGPILGVLPEVELIDREVTLHPGDVLLLYTDGLVNVRCGEHYQPMPVGRLCSIIRRHAELPAQELVQQLVRDAIGECETTDDITAIVVKREEATHD